MRILNIVDGLFVLLSVALIYAAYGSFQTGSSAIVVLIEPFLMAYCLFRIMFGLSHKWSSFVFIWVIATLCVYQEYLGYSQLLTNLGKNNGQDICVGSFSNSGPYGGFLAVCSTLLVAAYFKEPRKWIKITYIVIAGLALILLPCTLSRASILSFGVAMLVLGLRSKRVVALLRRYWTYITIAAVLICVGAYIYKKPSADGRLLMARVGLRMIKENGWHGVGLGNYSGAYGKAQAGLFEEYLYDEAGNFKTDNIPEGIRMVADCPTYAFNEYLRMGIEAGPVAMIVFILLIVAALVRLYKSDSYWLYPLICMSVFAFFSYPLEIDMLVFMSVLFLASANNESDQKLGTSAFFVLLFVFLGSQCIEKYRQLGLNRRLNPYSASMKRLCSSRTRHIIVNEQKWMDQTTYDASTLFIYGRFLNQNGNYELSDSVLMVGAEHSNDPMFWNVMGNNSLALGKYREAEQRYKYAFSIVPNRLYPLCLLAKLYYAQGDTLHFMEMAGIIRSFKAKVESQNTSLLRDEIAVLESEITYSR